MLIGAAPSPPKMWLPREGGPSDRCRLTSLSSLIQSGRAGSAPHAAPPLHTSHGSSTRRARAPELSSANTCPQCTTAPERRYRDEGVVGRWAEALVCPQGDPERPPSDP